MSNLRVVKKGMMKWSESESVSVCEVDRISKICGTMLFIRALTMDRTWQLAIEFAAINFHVSIVALRSISMDSVCLIY